MPALRPLRVLTGAALALAVAAPTASAAPGVSYDVTFKAQRSEQWRASENYSDDCRLTGAMCTRDAQGAGDAKLILSSRRPTRMLMMRGRRGGLPLIDVGQGGGVPVTGAGLRSGSYTVQYAGPWDAANPDVTRPTTDCGRRTVRGSAHFHWVGPGRISPVGGLDDLREGCPTGPDEGFEWPDDEEPSLAAVVADVAPRKFLGARQFTIRGSRTWTGVVEPVNSTTRMGSFSRDGEKRVTWTWEATFRRADRRKRRR